MSPSRPQCLLVWRLRLQPGHFRARRLGRCPCWSYKEQDNTCGHAEAWLPEQGPAVGGPAAAPWPPACWPEAHTPTSTCLCVPPRGLPPPLITGHREGGKMGEGASGA